MPAKKTTRLFAIVLFFLLFLSSKTLWAAEIALNVPGEFSTIQAAIDRAFELTSLNTGTTYSVLVEPSATPYPGGILLKSGISVSGRETARTIISAGGSGTAVTANGVTGIVTFSNFTIINATMGIDVSGNSTVKIMNNVFTVGTAGTAVRVQGSPGSEVINNTFYQNGIALARDSDVKVVNNIFANKESANISDIGSVADTNISYNCFHPAPTTSEPIGANSIPSTTVTNTDPLFVAPTAAIRDFHLIKDSPCIDAGTNINGTDKIDATQSDIGAYGGGGSDTIPFPVTILSAAADSSTSVALSWAPNLSYHVTNAAKPGSYNVYYKTGAVEGPPYTTTLNSAGTGTVVTGLAGAASPPEAPVLNTPEYADGVLVLSWSTVPDATGYKVHYVDSSTSVETTIDVGNTNFHILTGLVNGRDYGITVSAYSEAIYRFAVTALDNTTTTDRIPGERHESAYSSESVVTFGSPVEGLRSSPTQTAFPDPITANPNLQSSGCFIATAAYGYYSAPQVEILRKFRDHYLITNSPGRAFVKWYYHYGRIGADFINAHPRLKPLVRIALIPLMGAAWFMTESSLFAKITALLSLGFLCFYLTRRIISLRSGGIH